MEILPATSVEVNNEIVWKTKWKSRHWWVMKSRIKLQGSLHIPQSPCECMKQNFFTPFLGECWDREQCLLTYSYYVFICEPLSKCPHRCIQISDSVFQPFWAWCIACMARDVGIWSLEWSPFYLSCINIARNKFYSFYTVFLTDFSASWAKKNCGS